MNKNDHDNEVKTLVNQISDRVVMQESAIEYYYRIKQLFRAMNMKDMKDILKCLDEMNRLYKNEEGYKDITFEQAKKEINDAWHAYYDVVAGILATHVFSKIFL